jgi:hypothetical protein
VRLLLRYDMGRAEGLGQSRAHAKYCVEADECLCLCLCLWIGERVERGGERGMCEGRKGQGRVTSQRGQEAVHVHSVSREGMGVVGGVGVEAEVMDGGVTVGE